VCVFAHAGQPEVTGLFQHSIRIKTSAAILDFQTGVPLVHIQPHYDIAYAAVL
jgi:hypothetical protein